jgi:hypothetical protein
MFLEVLRRRFPVETQSGGDHDRSHEIYILSQAPPLGSAAVAFFILRAIVTDAV